MSMYDRVRERHASEEPSKDAAVPRRSGSRGASASTSTGLCYRRPMLLMFVVATGLMGLLTHMSFFIATTADGKQLVLPDVAEGTLAWYYYHGALQLMHALGITLFGSMTVIRAICVIAHGAHVGEAAYALSLCLRAGASIPVTLAYTVIVLLGGVTQLRPLKHAFASWQKHQRK